MRHACCLVMLLMFGLLGCSAGPDPDAPRITLYAIDPAGVAASQFNIPGVEPTPLPGHDMSKGYFHSYKVLGQVDLTGTDEGAALSAYLEEETDMPQGLIAGCFEPRHGLRVIRAGFTTDYVICFACKQFDWHHGSDLAWAGKQALHSDWYGRFTAPLTRAGIELAE